SSARSRSPMARTALGSRRPSRMASSRSSSRRASGRSLARSRSSNREKNMRSVKSSALERLVLRWAIALVIALGLIGHALAEDETSCASRRPAEHDVKKLETTLGSSLVRIEVERGTSGLLAVLSPLISRVEAPVEKETVAGIFVDKGHILTCLVEDPGFDPKLQVTFGKSSLSATLKARDSKSGLTLLDVAQAPESATAVSFSSRAWGECAGAALPTASGLKVSPIATGAKESEGADRPFGSAETLLLGAPIVTARGDVLGIVCSTT